MDLSGLIFVALAVAWAAYLIPKALRHHDDVVRGRSIDRFSGSMRVLARREPVSSKMATLVVTPARAAGAAVVGATRSAASGPADGPSAQAPSPESTETQHAARRAATRRATRRRRRVLLLLLLAVVAVSAACAVHRLSWPYVAIPGGLLIGWLVACRVMVRSERAEHTARPEHPARPDHVGHLRRPAPRDGTGEEDPSVRGSTSTGAAEPSTSGDGPPRGSGPDSSGPSDPELWDPVPVTLPTYVSKPPARRTVRTIDLDSTGVWTSGRTQADSALAREADAVEAAERVRRRVSRKDEAGDKAVGS